MSANVYISIALGLLKQQIKYAALISKEKSAEFAAKE